MIVYNIPGFTHTDVYSMPVYLRRFYWNKLVQTKTKENKAQEKAMKSRSKKLPKMPKRR